MNADGEPPKLLPAPVIAGLLPPPKAVADAVEVIGVAPMFLEKRHSVSYLKPPPKPAHYKPFRMCDQPWYADLCKPSSQRKKAS